MNVLKLFITLPLLVSTYACNTTDNTAEKEKPTFEYETVVDSLVIDHNGDTINRRDTKNRKQGKWVINHQGQNNKSITSINSDQLETEGYYKNDKKEGYWKVLSDQGLAVDSILYINGVQQITKPKTYTVN
jgi:hypothetical protein